MKKFIVCGLIIFLCQSAGAENLVLKGGYVIPDVQVLMNSGGIIQFKHEGAGKIWDLDQTYVELVSEFQPMDKKPILPSQLDAYYKALQQSQEVAKTLKLNSPEEAAAVYMTNCKDPFLAINCSILLPSAGHAYAGEWPRGLLFLFTEAILIGSMFIPLEDPVARTALQAAAYGGFLFTKGIEIYDVVVVTEEYNQALKQRLKIEVHGYDNGIGMRLKLEY